MTSKEKLIQTLTERRDTWFKKYINNYTVTSKYSEYALVMYQHYARMLHLELMTEDE